jgi:hypothetical protein
MRQQAEGITTAQDRERLTRNVFSFTSGGYSTCGWGAVSDLEKYMMAFEITTLRLSHVFLPSVNVSEMAEEICYILYCTYCKYKTKKGEGMIGTYRGSGNLRSTTLCIPCR